MPTSRAQDLSPEPGGAFRIARDFVFEDAALGRLRYHLLRLTTVGLGRDEVEDVRELGRLAFDGADITECAVRIRDRSGASRLAVAFVDIVEHADQDERGPVLVGAVLGAYTSLGSVGSDEGTSAALLGAVGGAVVAASRSFVDRRMQQEGLAVYLGDED
ncbi:hypothetical protein [Kitasatospora sp. DSM 101779]|uniref:hypothetical protein n=1 Tax=Kitasatospora sp. DSM 101779 TaxID=2853165 RepID=UPI0021D8EFC8|nr:hypothetical protein [Kitasatospora sp. DSM 101779]MCU7820673.1 hypothetical protein [Kitasatospora sp. DSM 101779]